MQLDDALKNFADAFAAGSENTGTVEYRAPQQFTAPFPLGALLTDYFAKLRLADKPQVGGQLLLTLFMIDELKAAQHGWRWISQKGGPVTDNPVWNKSWVVIGDRHGDALVVDDSTVGGTVSGNIGPLNFKIADDLAGFLQTLAEAMTVEATTYDYEVLDDDCNPDPAFLDEVSAIARRVLGVDGEAGFMKFFFG
jgi:hypothetical protein